MQIYKNYKIEQTTQYGMPCYGVFYWESGIDITGRRYQKWSNHPTFTAKTVRECKEAINCRFGRL